MSNSLEIVDTTFNLSEFVFTKSKRDCFLSNFATFNIFSIYVFLINYWNGSRIWQVRDFMTLNYPFSRQLIMCNCFDFTTLAAVAIADVGRSYLVYKLTS